jgi:hypothetical protein
MDSAGVLCTDAPVLSTDALGSELSTDTSTEAPESVELSTDTITEAPESTEPVRKRSKTSRAWFTPDRGVPPMSQLCFGKYTLDADYRMSMPPFYTANMIVATFLGRNQDHPGQSEWQQLMCEESEDSSGDGSDPDWVEGCSDDESSSSDESDGSDAEESEAEESDAEESDAEESVEAAVVD